MPTSDHSHIPDVLGVVIDSGAESVLDVGVGIGKWGALCREYIEVRRGRMPEDWNSRIDGIEIFENYRNPIWGAYSHVYIGDAIELLDTLGTYDVVLCADVIEHFVKAEGEQLLAKMLDHGRIVVITSPSGDCPQGAMFGNPHEEHKSAWSDADFGALPHRYVNLGITFIAAISKDEANLTPLDLRPLDERIGIRNAARMLGRLARRRILRQPR